MIFVNGNRKPLPETRLSGIQVSKSDHHLMSSKCRTLKAEQSYRPGTSQFHLTVLPSSPASPSLLSSPLLSQWGTITAQADYLNNPPRNPYGQQLVPNRGERASYGSGYGVVTAVSGGDCLDYHHQILLRSTSSLSSF